MADNFKAIIEVAYQLDQANKKLQSDIKKTQEQYKIKFKAEIDDKTATASIKNIQNYQDNFNKKNLSAIDMEIKKKQESASLFSKQIQSQMQERISAENKIQSELQKTTKLRQNSLNFESGKIQLDNNISTYLNENTKLSTGLKNRLVEIQSKIKDVDATELKNLKQGFREVTSEAKSLDQTGNSAFTKLGKNVSQFLSFMGAATITMTAINTVRNMIDEVKNLDDQLLELSKVSDLTAEGLSKVTEQAFELGRVVGKTGTQVLAAITSFQSAGYELRDSLDLAEQALVMTNIAEGIDDASISAKGLISIMKGYKNDNTDFAQNINDSINQVSNTQAIDFDNLVEGARVLSAVANQSQVSFEQMLGILTGGYEILGDMSKVANGAITIFSRLQAIQLEGEEGVSTIAKLQDTFSNATKGVVNIVDETTGQLRGAYDILDDLSGIWDSLDKNTQSALATEAAGVRQKNTFLSIVSNWGAVEESVKSASDSFGSASEENQKYLDSISGRISQFQSEFQKMSSLTVDSDLIKMVVDFGTSTLKATNAVGGLVPVLITLGVVAGVTKVAMNALLLSTEKQTIANLVAATSQVGLAGAIQLTGSAIKSFMLTNPVGWILALGTAVFGVVKIYDALTTSLDEQKEKLEQANTTYESSKTELESINSELQTTAKRIDELNSKDNLTFVEQGELEELKKVTDELLIQQDILEKQKAYDAKQLANETVNTFNKQFRSSNISQNQVDSYASGAETSGNNAILISDNQDISSMIAAYKQLTKLKQEAFDIKDSESGQDYKEALDDVSNSLYGNIADLTNWKSTLESIPLEDLTDVQKQALTDINNAIELIYQNIDPTKWKEIKFDSLISSADTKETVNELKELAKAGELTPEVLTSTKEYAYLLELTGLTAKEVTEQINAMTTSTEGSAEQNEKEVESLYSLAKAAEEATGYINDLGQNVDISKLQQSIDSALNSVEDFNSILKSMDTNKGLTSDDLDTITQKYPQLLSYIGDEKELRKQLTQGINDQKEVAKGYYEDVLELDTNLYNTIITNNATKVNELNGYYETDLSNLKSLARAKNEVETTLLTSLSKKWADYYSAQAGVSEIASHAQSSPLNSGIWGAAGGKDFNKDAVKMAQEQTEILKEKAKTEQFMYNQMKNLFVDTDYTGLNVDNILLGTDKSSSSGKGTKDKFSQVLDWLSIRIDKLKEKAQSTIDSIAKYTSYKTKNSKIDIAIQAKVDEKSSLKTIQDSYNKMAKNVNFSKDELKYRDLVDNGGMNVETITDEKLANKIEEYTKWKNAADEVGKSIDGINDEIKDLNSLSLDNIKSYFDSKNSTTESKISKRESSISLKEAQGKSATTGDYLYLTNRQNTLKSNAQTEYDSYNSELQSQITKGDIKVGDTKWKAATSYLLELETQINNCDIAIQGFNDSIDAIPVTKLQNKLKSLESSQQRIEDSISLKEANGGSASKSDYTDLIKLSNTKISTIQKENAEYKAQQEGLKKTDAKYIELQDKIDANLSTINACKIAQVNWNAEIRNLSWVSFDKAVNKLKLVKDNLSTLSSLISGDLVDKDGELTNSGITQLGIYAQQISNAKNEVSLYSNAISKLKKELANGTISQTQYDEELANNISLQNQAAVSIKEYEKSIIELNKKAIEAQTEEMKKLTQARKDELSAQKTSDDYAKKVKKSQDGIGVVKKKIAALALSTDRKDIAQHLALEKDLKEKESELTDIHTDHDYDTKVQALDDELKSYEKIQDAKLKALDNNLVTQQLAIKNSLSTIQTNYDTVLSNINTLASTYGVDLTDSITSPWTNATNAAQLYKDLVSSITVGNLGSTNPNSSQYSQISSILANGHGDGSGTSKLNAHVTSLGFNQLTLNDMVKLAKVLNISGINKKEDLELNPTKKNLILDALKKAGFKNGGYIESSSINNVVRSNGDNVLMTGKVGEAVFKEEEVKMIKLLTSQIPTISNLIGYSPNLSNLKSKEYGVNIHYDSLVRVDGNLDSSVDINKIVLNAIDKNNATMLKVLKQSGIK